MASALLREARPKQWAKNVLVFAAPGSAGVLDNWTNLWPTLVAFAALSLSASGTYYWNDILDVEAGRAMSLASTKLKPALHLVFTQSGD